MFTHHVRPEETGNKVFKLAFELSEIAEKMAKEQGVTPKDARLALEFASRVSATKETPAVMAQKLADVIVKIQQTTKFSTELEPLIDELVTAASTLIDEQ
ncbi:TPA: hypothetical protein U5D76_000725 [Yersinia enterocolitica]|nr:hypothetical protein [Yersinia enterocolitica]